MPGKKTRTQLKEKKEKKKKLPSRPKGERALRSFSRNMRKGITGCGRRRRERSRGALRPFPGGVEEKKKKRKKDLASPFCAGGKGWVKGRRA